MMLKGYFPVSNFENKTNFIVHSYETYKYQWDLQKAIKLTSNDETYN